MITVERRVDVARPLPAVWEYLADFTHTEAWDPYTISTTRTDSGPLGLGSTFHNVSEFRGRRTELDYRVVRFDRDEHLTFSGTNRTVDSTDDMAFRGDDTRTVITYRAHFAFKRWARFTEPLLRRTFEKIANDTVVVLIQALESAID